MPSTENTGCQIGSFVFMLIAFIAFLTAFSTTYWIEKDGVSYGLWRACSGDMCTQLVGTGITTVSFTCAQIMFCVALMVGGVSIGGHIGWVMLGAELTCVIAWAAQIAAAFLTAIGLILWGNESYRYFGGNYLGWSYWVTMFSATVMAFTGGITGCKTACATRLERGKSLIYSSSAARGAMSNHYNTGHDESDYSDMTQSDYSMANMAPQGRPLPPRPPGGHWEKERGYGVGNSGYYPKNKY